MMYHCVNCGAEVAELYTRYCPNVLKLLKCDQCKHMADKYIEYDPVIILVDLILLDKRAYRHLLYNCDLKPWWKLVIIIWLVESFRNLSFCNDNENNTGTSKTFQHNFDGYCNLYLILFKTAFSLVAYVVIVIILTKIKWFFYVKNPNKYSTTHLSKAIVIGGSGKLLGLLEITWGHIFLAPHYLLILGYTLLCWLTAYSVVSNSGKLESIVVLGFGTLVYIYASNFSATMFESLELMY